MDQDGALRRVVGQFQAAFIHGDEPGAFRLALRGIPSGLPPAYGIQDLVDPTAPRCTAPLLQWGRHARPLPPGGLRLDYHPGEAVVLRLPTHFVQAGRPAVPAQARIRARLLGPGGESGWRTLIEQALPVPVAAASTIHTHAAAGACRPTPRLKNQPFVAALACNCAS
jgi:hypothetical protein